MFGLSILCAWWCACAQARVLGLVRVHYCTKRLEEWRACSRGPGTTLRWTNAWNWWTSYRTFDEGCHGTLGQRFPRGFLVFRLTECTKRRSRFRQASASGHAAAAAAAAAAGGHVKCRRPVASKREPIKRSIQSTHHCTDTSYEGISMTTQQTPSWRRAYRMLQQFAGCARLKSTRIQVL